MSAGQSGGSFLSGGFVIKRGPLSLNLIMPMSQRMCHKSIGSDPQKRRRLSQQNKGKNQASPRAGTADTAGAGAPGGGVMTNMTAVSMTPAAMTARSLRGTPT